MPIMVLMVIMESMGWRKVLGLLRESKRGVIVERKERGREILTDVVGDSLKVLANDQSHCVCVLWVGGRTEVGGVKKCVKGLGDKR